MFRLVFRGDAGGLAADVDARGSVVLHAEGVGFVGDGVHLVDGEGLSGHI